MKITPVVCCLMSVFTGAVSVYSQEGHADAAAQANNPLANTSAFNLHDYYIGAFTEGDQDGNQFIARYAKPLTLGEGSWLLRASLPVNSFPVGMGGSTETGLGDFNVFVAYLFDTGNPGVSVGLGPQLTAPTASKDLLGSEKWSGGFAHVYFNAKSSLFQYGYLLTWQASFAGSDDRDDVNIGAVQPFVFYQLGGGLYLRSTGIMVYDFNADGYTIPLGLGLGKVIPSENIVYNVFIEPQYSVWDDGGSYPQWQIFVGFNTQF